MNAPAAVDPERYRTLRRRIVAGIIDLLALQLLWSANDWVHRKDPAVVLWVAWYVVFRCSLVGYSVLLHARWGQTLGKRLRGLRLMDAGEQHLPTMWQCLRRDALPVLQLPIFLWLVFPALLRGRDPSLDSERVLEIVGLRWISSSWIVAELVTMFFFRRRGRSLQDYLAGTVVVRTDVGDGAAAADAPRTA